MPPVSPTKGTRCSRARLRRSGLRRRVLGGRVVGALLGTGSSSAGGGRLVRRGRGSSTAAGSASASGSAGSSASAGAPRQPALGMPPQPAPRPQPPLGRQPPPATRLVGLRRSSACRLLGRGAVAAGEHVLGQAQLRHVVEVRLAARRRRRASAPPDRRSGSTWPSTRLIDSDRRRRSESISRIFTFTSSPGWMISRGFSTWCCASSEMCTRPSTPSRISTNAPNVTTFVTLPSSSSPTL